MRIRPFDFERDYAAAIALWQTAGPGVHVGRSDAPDELRKKLARAPDRLLVAKVDGRLAGTALGGFDGRRGMVYHLAVDPTQRSRGLATALMTDLEHRLRAKGCLKCYLMVDAGTAELVAFYQRLGWEIMAVQALGKVLDGN